MKESMIITTNNNTSTVESFSESKETIWRKCSPVEVVTYYKELGDWKRSLPKTDNTYSPSSKFYNKEIAPGIPVIPNMSRSPVGNGHSNIKMEIVNNSRYFSSRKSATVSVRKTVIIQEYIRKVMLSSIRRLNSFYQMARIHITESRLHSTSYWIIVLFILLPLIVAGVLSMFPEKSILFLKDVFLSGIYIPCSILISLLQHILEILFYTGFSVFSWILYAKEFFIATTTTATTSDTPASVYNVSSIKSIIRDEIDIVIRGLKQDIQSAVEIEVMRNDFHVEKYVNSTVKEITDQLIKDVTNRLTERVEVSHACQKNSSCELMYSNVTEQYINEAIQRALKMYDADKTGMVDYALETSGGEILSTRCTETIASTATFSLFGFPLWHIQRNPRIVIQPGVYPGECWAFAGSTGFLVIKLSQEIYISGFHLEHIPNSLAPSGNINSAPKDFSVWGLRNEMDKEQEFLGRFSFNANDNNSLQYFEAIRKNVSFGIVEFRIESNHGKSEYTCIYRFRVHGIPFIN